MKWDKENEKSIIHWWASVEQLLSSTVSQSMGWITRSFWLYFYRMNEDDEVITLIQVKTDFILVCKGSRTCWLSSTLFWALSWDQCDCYVWLLGVTNRFYSSKRRSTKRQKWKRFFFVIWKSKTGSSLKLDSVVLNWRHQTPLPWPSPCPRKSFRRPVDGESGGSENWRADCRLSWCGITGAPLNGRNRVRWSMTAALYWPNIFPVTTGSLSDHVTIHGHFKWP